MTTAAMDVSDELCTGLADEGFGPFFGTPCGILSPLYRALEEHAGLTTVAREDNAVGIAAGAALAGRCPAVLMQNSGLGQSVNAIASLVVPYRIALLFIVSVRGVDPDPTQENLVMGRLTESLLVDLGLPARALVPGESPLEPVGWASRLVRGEGRSAALLVPPTTFGWRA
jgi:sulfopyruvate decarboxylase subunit alpha